MTIHARLRLPDLGSFPPVTPRVAWTFVGASAIPLWAMWPLLAALTSSSMPLFQYCALIYASGATVLYLLPRSNRPELARPSGAIGWAKSSTLLAAVMFGLGLLVSSVLFIWAFDHISVAQANLILYLWPVMVVVLCVPLRLVRPKVAHLTGIAIAMMGAALVIGGDTVGLSWTGVGLAAAGGFVWAVFVVFRIWQGESAPDALAPGLALAAAVAAVAHLLTEVTLMPTAPAIAGAILIGILPSALGNLAWDHGVRKGDKVLLATLAYATPLVGALLLILFGFATATPGLMLGAVLIVAAGIIVAR
jgi:drug/metabolite transporter (DMT)-like permease